MIEIWSIIPTSLSRCTESQITQMPLCSKESNSSIVAFAEISMKDCQMGSLFLKLEHPYYYYQCQLQLLVTKIDPIMLCLATGYTKITFSSVPFPRSSGMMAIWKTQLFLILAQETGNQQLVWWNLSKCSTSIKTSAYLTLVRPIMEYAAVAWDPHQCNNIQTFEKIQRRAAYWVINDYNRYSNVSDMLHNLNWQPLQLCHRISRL